MKLHQALALHKGAFSRGEGALTRVHQSTRTPALLSGLMKTYQPKDMDGQQLPGEGVKLQIRVPTLLAESVPALVDQIDLQATVDVGNQTGMADIKIDGTVLVESVPIETLLFLEKKLKTFMQVLDNLPVVDEAEEWEPADDGLSWKTKPSEKVRTDKVPHAFVKAAATDKHPAQVDTIFLDQVVGTWSTVKFSGALKANQKTSMQARARKLLAAVQVARGEANSVEVEQQNIGQAIFDYLDWA